MFTTVLVSAVGGLVVQAVCWALRSSWVPDLLVPRYYVGVIFVLGLRFALFTVTAFIVDFAKDEEANAGHL